MTHAWLYTLVPVTAAVLGATVAAVARPRPVLVSAVQHLAAGVVFAAAAGEILPDLLHRGSACSVAVAARPGRIG